MTNDWRGHVKSAMNHLEAGEVVAAYEHVEYAIESGLPESVSAYVAGVGEVLESERESNERASQYLEAALSEGGVPQ